MTMFLEPVFSIIQFPFYREVPSKSYGKVFGYIVYLGLFFSILSTTALYIRLTPVVHEAVEWAASSIPKITVADGKVTADLSAPLVLRYPKDPKMALVIDTNRTAPVTAQDMEQQQAAVYLTQNSLYLIGARNQVEHYDLAGAKNSKPVVIDGEFFRSLEKQLPKIFYPVAFLAAWLVFFLWKSASSLFYSLAAMAINAILSAELEYEALFKIAVYAQTPLIVLQMVMLFIPQRVFGFWLIAFAIVSVYLWQAIRQHLPAAGAEPADSDGQFS